MIPWSQIERAGVEAAAVGVQRGLERISTRAKELAPVRKVFGQFEAPYKVRMKTISEVRADRGLRKQLGLGPEDPYIHPPLIRVKNAPKHLRDRKLQSAVDKYTGRVVSQRQFQTPANVDMLDRRGRYEYKTMRAAHGESLGGRLRSEIHATAVEIRGKMIHGQVLSPTPYAKYQELGTRHNPAHPYLRPAGHENRDVIRRDIGRSVVSTTKPLFRGRMEVVIKTRAR